MHKVVELHLEGDFKRIVLNHTCNNYLFSDEVNKQILDDVINLKRNFTMNYYIDRDEWDIVLSEQKIK